MSRREPEITLREGWQQSSMTAFEMWLAYFTLGGEACGLEVEAYIYGLLRPDNHEHNLIARVLNSHLAAAGLPSRIAYLSRSGH
jgi:hypothetical protein